MSLAKKCDTRDRLSAGRARSQHSFRSTSHSDRVNSTEIETDGARGNRMSFAEDFLLEHTNSSIRIGLIGMAGKSGNPPREQQKSAQCYGFPS
jgi:hypothetical protein